MVKELWGLIGDVVYVRIKQIRPLHRRDMMLNWEVAIAPLCIYLEGKL